MKGSNFQNEIILKRIRHFTFLLFLYCVFCVINILLLILLKMSDPLRNYLKLQTGVFN